MCKLHDPLVNNCGIRDAHSSALRNAVNEHSEEQGDESNCNLTQVLIIKHLNTSMFNTDK